MPKQERIRVSQDFTLCNLNINVRSYHVIIAAFDGIAADKISYAMISQVPEDEWIKMHNCGRKSANEIIDVQREIIAMAEEVLDKACVIDNIKNTIKDRFKKMIDSI